MADLRTAAQQALEALRAYGAHAHNCDFLILLTSNPPQRKPCSCGLVSSIKSIEAALAEPEPVAGYRSCSTHCCPVHGCKYGHRGCPVHSGQVKPEYPKNNGCEYCESAPEPIWQTLAEIGASAPAGTWDAPVEPAEPGQCECHRCIDEKKLTANGLPLSLTKMIVCPTCGNKRCPHASDHRLACTGSNEPGQPGSVYTTPPTRQPLTETEMYAVEDEARKNFMLSQRGPRGQQIVYWDALTPWLIRATERAHKIGGNDE